MKATDVYFIRGQGGATTSGGIDQMAAQVSTWPGARAQIFDWQAWQSVVADINKHADEDRVRMACGYSLGANALTWVLEGVKTEYGSARGIERCSLEFCSFIDCTWLSTISMLTPHTMRRGIHFKNVSLDVVGHGDIPCAPGTNLEVIQTFGSHLMLDFDSDVQSRTLSAMHANLPKAQGDFGIIASPPGTKLPPGIKT
jgi:hypothetical protein